MPLILLRHFRCVLKAMVLLSTGVAAFSQGVRDRAVEINATVQETPPQIALQWTATGFTVVQERIYRRLKNGPVWKELAQLATSATSYVDSAVTAGVNYEYRVARQLGSGPGWAFGYISAGIRAPLVTERGRVILLVDDSMAVPLASELTQFTSDLVGDGWTVVQQNVARTSTPPAVRAEIQTIYNADPANTVAVILFGHIPVAYSGDQSIDGHNPDHYGAWPADVYYGDMDGTWTDTEINDTRAGDPRNYNVPGDGKFDQTAIPSDIELQVGRIDLANLPAFNATETELLRRYLNRDHQYRHLLGDYASIGRRGLVDDNFSAYPYEAYAVTGWRSFATCVGLGNVQELDWFTTLQTDSYLWALGCGPGYYTLASGVGTTNDFATKNSRAVFNILFGSYFGDWDSTNNLLRASLAERTPQESEIVASLGLITAWAGLPHWVFHPMALGETAGYCARLSQNNAAASGYDSGLGERLAHIALMGDPTLRLYPVIPPGNFTATAGEQAVTLAWSAPADAPIEGYVISRASLPGGQYQRLRNALSTETTYLDRSAIPGASYSYMVRAVKVETSPTGTYLNPSQGVFSDPTTVGAATRQELEIQGNGIPIVAGDTAPQAANGTDFGSVDTFTAVTRTFVLSNVGVAPLALTGAAVTGANAGDFTIVSTLPSTLAPGTSANVAVQFSASVLGSRAATLSFTSDDDDEGTYAFALGAFVSAAPREDFNADGKPDYPLFKASTGQTGLWFLNGAAFVSGANGPTLPAGWSIAGVADFNADHKPDFVVFKASTGQTGIWYLNGAAFVSGANGPTLPAGWSIAGVADFNRDGKPDYLLFKASTGQTGIWYMNGAAFVGGANGPTLPAGWSIVSSEDWNGDGKPDYLLVKASTGQTGIWYMNGATFVSGATGPTLPAGWSLVSGEDFNADGKPDYSLIKASTGQTGIWYMNGPNFSSSASGPTLPSGWTVVSY